MQARRYVEFSGGESRSGPLTWSQRGMWDAIGRNPPAHFNFGVVVPVPPEIEADPDDVERAVGQLMTRHESLRTLVRLRNGQPEQQVVARGLVELRVVESTVETAAAEANAAFFSLRAAGFDHAHEWPVRMAAVVVDGSVRWVVFAFSHVAADNRGAAVVARELLRLLRPGAVLDPVGLQPLDIAAEQRIDDGRRTRAAIEFWTGHYRRIPAATMVPRDAGRTPEFRRAILRSRALYGATRLVAAKAGVFTSTVLQAAAAVAIGEMTGADRVAISLIASNRMRQRVRDTVSTLDQLGLFVLDLPAGRPGPTAGDGAAGQVPGPVARELRPGRPGRGAGGGGPGTRGGDQPVLLLQ